MSFLAGGLPLFLVITVTATLGQQEISRLELQRVTAQLNFLNQTFADFFKVAQRQVVMMSKAPTLKSMSWERIEPYLKEENHRSREYFEKFILGKPNGQFYNTKGGNPRQGGIRTFDDKDPVSKPKTIKKRTYWQKTIQEEGVYISEPMVSYTTGARQIVISSSITNEKNNIVGMLGGGISWKKIENLVALLNHYLF
jgi:two-component system, sensor histidine kinase